MNTRLIVIGNGMAGIKVVEEIVNLAPGSFQITVFGAEPYPNYNRIMLSKMVQGNASFDDIVINDWTWYKERGIKLYAGETVARINTTARTVETVSGIKESYDILIIATGSSAFIPPIPGTDKNGVIAFRNVDDCTKMMEASKVYSKAAVIGGGLLGLEAARGLLNLGMETEVVHNAPHLMNRQLDETAARMLQRELEGQGMRFKLSKNTVRITGRSRAQGLQFSDGSRLAADLIVLAVGIRPNVELARSCGIHTNRAIVVDDYMRTNIPGIYAVGECAEHRGTAYGLVAPLYEQGKVLAKVICGVETGPYTGSVPYSQLKVSGVDVFSAGDINDDQAETAVQMYDGIRGTYKKVTMSGGVVSGAILFGDTAEGTSLLGLVKRAAPVSALSAGDSGKNAADEAAASMPDNETVCACNAVSKAAIMCAVLEEGLSTADQVKERTRASGSCGGCRPMVEALVRHTLASGGSVTVRSADPVCDCTGLDHESLKEALLDAGCGTPAEAMSALGWNNEQGCPVCRPAIQYYLETMNHNGCGAAVSEGGTACAGGESIAGTGADAEGGEGRNVGVTVRFGVDESIDFAPYNAHAIGKELENSWSRLTLPASVRAVFSSGYPAGVLVHDIGLTGSPAGWEVYAGGHAEHPVKQGQLIGTVETDEEARSLAAACLQLYREGARYDEPVWKWLERAGVLAVRESLLDPAFREELVQRQAASAAASKHEAVQVMQSKRSEGSEEGAGEANAAVVRTGY
ncbi:nitrite reductase large subunit NirB [Paenibacillus beijingensis]|uniref:Nitrite reductase n=1 Tax=Paenibacillus beijingensis TaxID=1126833 RepID=A0A0D5NS40_9BACL|nr:nitrite reductase [Paenibacillus beijingensis]